MSTEQQSKFQVLKFATVICLACSLVVSTSAVALRSFQEKNALNEKRINILRAAGLTDKNKLSSAEIDEKFHQIIPVVVNFKSGELNTSKNPQTYDMYAVAQSKDGHSLENDPANIKRQADDGTAYIVIDGDKVTRIVIPIQGYGLWSTMYGFTAVNMNDKTNLAGLTFYSQAETPGLGAEVTNPKWQEKWIGIEPYNEQGVAHIEVKKTVDPNAKNQVDAISGSTLTSRGVENLMNYWLGDAGYREFIENVKNGKISLSDIKAAAEKTKELNGGKAS